MSKVLKNSRLNLDIDKYFKYPQLHAKMEVWFSHKLGHFLFLRQVQYFTNLKTQETSED